MDMDINKWKNRYTVRKFDETNIPTDEQIQHIVDVIKYVPSQEGKFDHVWIVLSPNDSSFKKWLTKNVFYHDNDSQGREFMIQVLTAPYVFLCVRWLDNGEEILDCKRNIGIHAGTILSEALFLGLDAATIGCTTGITPKNKNYDNVILEFNKKIKQKYKTLIDNSIGKTFNFDWNENNLFRLDMAVCIGCGEPLTKRTSQKNLIKHHKFRYFPGQKRKKLINNVVYSKDQDAEN
jgi:hypothetical protein